ncbi:Peptidyl-prolyl cis-trans isomerase-like 4, partial [Lunasporangiospora selenospora]
MSVLLETSVGDIVIDLHIKEAPTTCLNFLKLCKVKYYNFCCFHNVQKDFMVQTGDPTATGKGGESIYGVMGRDASKKFLPAEIHPQLKHRERGTVSMAISGASTGVNQDLNMTLGSNSSSGSSGVIGSQFFITMGEDLDYLDGKYTIFGKVAEGMDVLEKINGAYTDPEFRPYRDVRIKHTIVLDDPFPDPEGLEVPDESPLPTQAMLDTIKPPENVLFVANLNPATRSEDLELIFSRFGLILSCEVIRDKKSGDSLCYAFIEFEKEEQCSEAYFKMNNVLIDDRRIHVDFSQSVSKLHKDWMVKRMGDRRSAGVEDLNLEQKSRYRGETSSRRRGDEYELVFDNGRNNGGRSGSGRDGDRERDRDGPKDRDRDGPKDRDGDRRDSRRSDDRRSDRDPPRRYRSPEGSSRRQRRSRSRSASPRKRQDDRRGGDREYSRDRDRDRDRDRLRERDYHGSSRRR